MKKLFFAILYTLLIISLGGCKTVSKKIEDTTEKEKQKLSKWLNKPEEDLKSFYGQPDKVEFLKTRNRNYVYITEKYKIKCERKFEVNPNKIGLMGFSAGGAVTMQAAYEATENNQPNFIAPIYPWMTIVAPHKVPSNQPPAFISCANDDPHELSGPSVNIYMDWIAAGAEADLHMFSKGGHGFGTNKFGIPVDIWSDLLVDWILSL